MSQRRGIWPRLLDNGCVDDRAWREAMDARQYVGTCGECNSPLRPGSPFPQGRYRTGYTATCSGCGHEYGAHGPSDAPTKTTKKGAA